MSEDGYQLEMSLEEFRRTYSAGRAGEEIRKAFDVGDKPSKYGNVRSEYDGRTFDSKAEMRRYIFLKQMQDAGQISNLVCQPRIVIDDAYVDGETGERQRAVFYIGDFRYEDEDGRVVIEDVKGGKATQTQLFKLKWRLAKRRNPDILFRVVET